MTAKEKATELVNKFGKHVDGREETEKGWHFTEKEKLKKAKKCAKMCVNEILEIFEFKGEFDEHIIVYWKDVKSEIKNL